jgi:hypothetical protein
MAVLKDGISNSIDKMVSTPNTNKNGVVQVETLLVVLYAHKATVNL